MNVGKVSGLGFASRYRDENFYSLPQDKKLNAIYDKLAEIRMHQDYDSEVITNNQHNLHQANEHAFQVITTDYEPGYYKTKHDLITDVFESTRVGQLPRSGIDA